MTDVVDAAAVKSTFGRTVEERFTNRLMLNVPTRGNPAVERLIDQVAGRRDVDPQVARASRALLAQVRIVVVRHQLRKGASDSRCEATATDLSSSTENMTGIYRGRATGAPVVTVQATVDYALDLIEADSPTPG